MLKRIIILATLAIMAISCSEENDSQTITVKAYVYDYATGNPIINASIETEPKSETFISDSLGEVLLVLNDKNEYELIASKVGYFVTKKNINLENLKSNSIFIPLTKINSNVCTLRGYVTDANTGLPIPNVRVYIQSGSTTNSFTDPYGYYEISTSTSSATLKAEAPGYIPYSAGLKNSVPSIVEYSFKLADSSTKIPHYVKVYDYVNGKLLAGATVTIKNEIFTSNEKGVALIKLKYGQYLGVVSKNDYSDQQFNLKLPSSYDTTIVYLKTSKDINHYFRVLSYSNNEPIQGVKIESQNKNDVTDNNGIANIGLKLGLNTVNISKNGYRSKKISVDIQTENDTTDITLISDAEYGELFKDLLVYYSFDNSNANDESSNNNHGEIFNEHYFGQGKFGQAIHFTGIDGIEGSGGHIVMPLINLQSMSEFTISFWVKEEMFASYAGEYFFMAGDISDGAVIVGHAVKQNKDNGGYQKYLHFATGTSSSISMPSPLYIDEGNMDFLNWNFYTLTYNMGLMKAYINGKLEGTLNQQLRVSENYYGICRQWFTKEGEMNHTARFTGFIDEFKLFKRALDNSEIKNLFENNQVKN